MVTVVLVVHPRRPHAAEYASKASAWLAERGHTVVMPEDDAAALGLAELGAAAQDLAGLGAPDLGRGPTGPRSPEPAPSGPRSPEPAPSGPAARGPTPAGVSAPGSPAPDGIGSADPVALVVALGGDGTVLRAVRLVAGRGVPVLGVNLGRLGYLAQIEPDELIAALGRFLAGDYAIEDRMMLAISIVRAHVPAGRMPEPAILALNEAVLEKPRPGNSVHLATSIGGHRWTTYAGDGLIVATPTGSTAYSFSARGPIVSPTMRAVLLTPLLAHKAFDRALVVGADEPVRVEVSDDRPAALTVDGRDRGLLRRGDAIVCTAASPPARFVTFGDRDFYGILRTKFGVVDR